MAAAPRGGTLRSQWLGQELRELRDVKGILLKEAAEYLQRDPATVSRYETGFYPIRRPDLLALLDLYGVSDLARREKLLNLSQDIWQKGWWDGYAGDVVGSLVDFVWLESQARQIQSFAAIVMPGLLQTPAYAETVIRANDTDATPEQIPSSPKHSAPKSEPVSPGASAPTAPTAAATASRQAPSVTAPNAWPYATATTPTPKSSSTPALSGKPSSRASAQANSTSSPVGSRSVSRRAVQR